MSACITIGNFDGVHLGHRSLINLAREIATARNLDLVILTFWPHPRDILPGSPGHKPLSSRETKLRLLSQFQPSKIVELPFTPALAALDPGAFITQYLLPLNLHHLVIGHDFTLGKGRQGNAAVLSRMADQYAFDLTQAAPFCCEDGPVSSTRIRDLVAKGDVASASRLLGRPHSVEGTVTKGFQRGRTLGFPTANLAETQELLPANGVYATHAFFEGKQFPAITNIGVNPTFNGTTISTETFLLDTHPDLYNHHLRLEFIDRIRPEIKFANAGELTARISEDINMAKKILHCPDAR